MARLKVLLALVPMTLLLSPSSPLAATAGGEAEASQAGKKPALPMYWGAWLGPELTGAKPPWDMTAVSHMEAMVGKGLSLVEFASPFADCHSSPCEFFDFPAAEMEKIRRYGAIPFLSWGSQSTPWESGRPEENQQNIRLADVISGAHDAYIRRFAAEVAAWGHPFFLRFNWEMNGAWFPWGEEVNGNSRGQFVPTWRHVHDVFEQAGATNVTWVWCPYAFPRKKRLGLRRFYPGSAYVDWTCLDVFNWGRNSTNSQPWRNFAAIIDPSYRQITGKIAPRKPMILAELASSHDGGSKARWIRGMLRDLERKYRKVRGFVWFNQVDRGIQWPLEASPGALGAFSRGVRKKNYLANVYANLTASPIPPPG